MSAVKTAKSPEQVLVERPNFGEVTVTITGESPYVQHRFSEKSRKQMEDTQQQGQRARGKKERTARDPQADYESAFYRDKQGRYGIPCAAFRNAMISACRISGVVMTRAKLSIFVVADTVDAGDGTPLTLLTGTPTMRTDTVRNDDGSADIRYRPMWREGWTANVKLRWDDNQFSVQSVVNLLHRAGLQVGVGEGRPDSKNSCGMGWGQFTIMQEGK